MTTKLFFDTEFTGLHQKTTLISIGIISEDGRTFYAEFTDYDKTQCDDWINENVIANLEFGDEEKQKKSTVPFLTEGVHYKGFGDTATIRKYLQEWISQFDSVQMWSDCLAYDWVLFCQIFGHAFGIPQKVYYIPFDICTMLLLEENNADISREEYATDTFWENEYGIKTPAFFDEQMNKVAPKKHNALWDAQIIRACYNKLISKRALAKK